ncbi:hypothetical protein D3C85_724230 [compost metagenome]
MIGEVYGRFTVLELHSNIKYQKKYLCRCSCGTEKVVSQGHLRSGHSKSCGCINTETPPRLSHGLAGTKLYKVYYAMLDRCQNPKSSGYPKYGALGITVCPEWQASFDAFHAWASSSGYKEGLTIDRDNVFGPYSPSNCRWVDDFTQSINKKPKSPYPYISFNASKGKWVGRLTLTTGNRVEICKCDSLEEAKESVLAYVHFHNLEENIKVLAHAGIIRKTD